jgi:integrase
MMAKTKFWQQCLKRLGESTPFEAPNRYQHTLLVAQSYLDEAIANFRKELSKIPIGIEIENWLQSLDLPQEIVTEYESNMLRLIEISLLKLTRDKQIRSINELSPNEHQEIIEEIRCSTKLTIPEKEKAVHVYILFSQHLSRVTRGLITQGEDPDFQRTIKKVVKYKEFIEFVQLLTDRDALIAKLLYFGAPTMDEVLNLRVSQINQAKGVVKFNKFSVRYPKHVMIELKSYLLKKEKKELIFMNNRGEMVERTHLNNCFNRACRKTLGNKRIIPKMLLEMLLESDVENSVAAHWPFASLSIQ